MEPDVHTVVFAYRVRPGIDPLLDLEDFRALRRRLEVAAGHLHADEVKVAFDDEDIEVWVQGGAQVESPT
jgi:hypothetical protein